MRTETLENRTYNGMEIAVIGMAGRFPGASDLDEYWDNLKNGIESIFFFSDEELIEEGVPPALLENPNYVRAMPVLDGVEYFDAAFFEYPPADAELLEPQVRLFHEYSWCALEDAGYNPESFRGLIGVFYGGLENPAWRHRVFFSQESKKSFFTRNLLTSKDFLSTRISYKLNLKGPSFTIYTGCSTALTSIHMASRSLLGGECDLAIAGGVVTTLTKEGFHYQEGMIFSADGHVHSFDEKATGTMFGGGIGVVVLKLLDAALADRDDIYAIIKGSAVNNDGSQKVSFTAPSVKGQAYVIKTAHQIAEIDPATISYIETHGTGTDLGDSIEIKALKQAFSSVDQNYTCKIGSVKTNFGHLDSAAGSAGFIKTVLALTHRLIPPTLHFETPNPNCQLDSSPFRVNTGLSKWENGRYPLRAGVSSFGFGGTNAHVVLEEAPLQKQRPEHRPSRRYQLLLISAKAETALQRGTENLLNHLKANPGINLADAAYTLQVGRKAFEKRRMLIITDVNEAIDALSSPGTRKVQTTSVKAAKRSIVFMFPGQGAQYVNMGLEIYRTEPVFRQEMDRCFEILNNLVDYNIKEILYPTPPAPSGHPSQEGSRGGSPCPPKNCVGSPWQGDHSGSPLQSDHINQTEITQPVIFAIEYALAKLLMKWGIKPDAMIGHSIGEFAAACLAGVFSLEDALKLVVLRGRLMQKMPAGAMLSVTLPEEELRPLLTGKELFLAAVNSSSLCTVSGNHQAIDAFEKELEEKGIGKRRIHTSHAFHSSMMDPILEEFETHVQQVKLNKPGIPYISNVTGTWITVEDAADPGYWAKHLRGTIRFAGGLEELLNEENSIFIEVGPGLVLSSFVNKHKNKRTGHVTKNLVRHPQEPLADDFYLLNKIGELWLSGIHMDWSGFYSGEKRFRLHLPTYSFDRTRYWMDPVQVQVVGDEAINKSAIKREISDWFYIPSWIRTSLPTGKKSEISDPIHCLIFMDECNLGSTLLDRFAGTKLEAVIVKAGTAFARESQNYVINPKEEKDYERLFTELVQSEKIPAMIIHLWSVTPGNHCMGDEECIENTLEKGFYSLLHISRAIGNSGITKDIRLKVITSNMQEVNGSELLCPEKAPILGAIKVIPLEFENITCDCIDIDFPGPGIGKDDILVDQLLLELESGPPDMPIAYRGYYRWVQCYEPVHLEKPENPPLRLREQGVYLVTGGLGGIGLVLAEHLARSVKARIILVGRSAFPLKEEWDQWLATHEIEERVSQKIRKIKEMEEMGARVMIARADMTDQQQLKDIFTRVCQQFGRINGVIHSAGLADYGGIIQIRSRKTTEEVLAPKVIGTLILNRIMEEQDVHPDFFLLCSSVASIIPSFGEVGYVGANAFLDQFAHFKSASSGVDCMSINWLTWKETGMAVDAAERIAKKKGASAGQELLKDGILSSQGIDIFNRILDNPFRQVVLFQYDLKTMVEQYRISKREPKASQTPVEDTSSKQKYDRPNLITTYVAPDDEIEKKITDIWQDQLGIQKIGIHDNFFDLGADSLNIVQARIIIKKVLKKDIPIVAMYTYPTVSALKDYLQEEKTAIGFTEEETQRLQKKESKGRGKLKQRQKRVKS